MTTTSSLTGTNATGTAGKISERAHEAVDRAAAGAAPVIDRASSATHRAIDKVVETATPAAEWVADSGRQLADRSTALADAASGYVRARPLVTVAGALLVGYIAGRILSSR